MLHTLSSCNKKVEYEKVEPRTEQAPAAQTPKIQPVGDVVPVSFKFLAARPESWSKNCVSLSLVNDPATKKELGCNKTLSIGAESSFDLAREGCNEIRLEFSVYLNKEKCPAGKPCEGSYGPTPDLVRTSDSPDALKVIRVLSADKMFPIKDIKLRHPSSTEAAIEAEYKATEKEAAEFVKTPGNTWLRVFFEDQNNQNMASWEKDKSTWQTLGVDYNDLVFDLKASNVKFKIVGSNIDTCATK